MKKLLTFLLFFLSARIALATAIVLIVTPNYIILGTDSKRQLLDANSVMRSSQQVCKIQSAGSYCFALAGYTSSQATQYFADKIISRHLKESGSYAHAMQRIKSELKASLTKELQYRQQQQPAIFAQMSAANEPLLELVVLSIKNGAPQMEIIGFEKSAGKEITVGSYTVRCPGDCPGGSQQLYFMGSYHKMEQYLAGRQQPIAEPAQLIETLIMEQARATPTSVGAPVQVARFSAKGLEWLK